MHRPSEPTFTRLPRRGRLAAVLVLAATALTAASAAGTDRTEFRTITGWNNNRANPDWGMAETMLTRWSAAAYADGASAPAGTHRPSPREISNTLLAQDRSRPDRNDHSDIVWMWGQFLDHDLSLSQSADPVEPFDIPVPMGDPIFDPFGTGNMFLALDRSVYEAQSNPRQQINQITSYIDGSMVYGSDEARALALRTLDGTGRLKTSAGDLLPFNTEGLPNAPNTESHFFLAGDVRANEQVALTALHTLFVREHNYWADRVERRGMSDEEIYQKARALVGAIIQSITYNEFLPVVLGDNALPRYRGYRDGTEPSIANVFSTAAYRFGHSMLSPSLRRLDPRMHPIAGGELTLVEAFFNPQELIDNGIEPLLRGGTDQVAQQLDNMVVDEVRNMLFGVPGTPGAGTDLASLNIQRGRDHGLPDYNSVRRALGLEPARTVADVTRNDDVQLKLLLLYPDIDDMDLWAAGLAEDPVRGALVGETFWHIIRKQFINLRDGDRFYYENHLDRRDREIVNDTRLIDVIRRNTRIGGEVDDNVWQVGGGYGGRRR